MSDYTTYLADNPNATSKTAFEDGSKFHVMTDENGKVRSLFDWEGSKFGDYTYESGAFSGTSSENISNYLNNKAVWTNSVGLTNDTVKNETQEKSQKDSSTKYTVVGVKNKREGTLWSENAFSTKSRTLVYPEDHAAEEYDFIKITPIEYVPALGSDNFGANSSKDMSQFSNADMIRTITKGGPSNDLSPIMPSCGNTISEKESKNLVLFIRHLCDCKFDPKLKQKRLQQTGKIKP